MSPWLGAVFAVLLMWAPSTAQAQSCAAGCPPGYNNITAPNFFGAYVGGGGADCIIGSAGADLIVGGGGNDLICGRGGDDTIYGDSIFTGAFGNDIIYGEGGNDTIYGQEGTDILDGGTGADEMYGGDGNDILYGQSGADQLFGEAGDDRLEGGDNNDTLSGGAGFDYLLGGAGNDSLSGGTENDVLDGGANTDSGDGGPGTDNCLVETPVNCELATYASIRGYGLERQGARTLLRFDTAGQLGSVSFAIRCQADDGWRLVAEIEANPDAIDGERYQADVSECGGGALRFRIEEQDVGGGHHIHGPFVAQEGRALAARRATASIASMAPLRMARSAPGPGVGATIEVDRGGVLRVRYAELAGAMGTTALAIANAAASGNLRLTHDGFPLSWQAELDGVVFFLDRPRNMFRAYDAVQVSMEAGTPMGTLFADASAPGASRASAPTTATFEDDVLPALSFGYHPDTDYWFWTGLSSTNASYRQATLRALPADAVAGTEARVRVLLRGASRQLIPGEHHVLASVGGTVRAEVRSEGDHPYALEFQIGVDELVAANGDIRLEAHETPGVSFDWSYVDRVEIDYQRHLVLGPEPLRFQAGGGEHILAEVGDPSEVYVLAMQAGVAERVDGWTVVDGTLELTVPTSGQYVIGRAVDLEPGSVRTNVPSNLRNRATAADYLVITDAELTGEARRLLLHRQAQGLNGLLVDVEDIYDEFASGHPDPRAVQRFLQYAHDHWSEPPRYVVLTGKGHFDYRNRWDLAGSRIAPLLRLSHQGLSSSDLSLGDVDPGTPGFEIAVGRLPVTSAEELGVVVDKIIAFEDRWAQAPGAARSVLMVAEGTGAVSFQSSSQVMAERLPDAVSRTELALTSSVEDRQLLMAALQEDSPYLVNYVGHGGITQAGSAKLIDVDEAMALRGEPFLFSAASCLLARFEYPGLTSLGEALVLAPEGGAVASWASSAVSIHQDAERLFGEWMEQAFSARAGARLGDRLRWTAREFLEESPASESLLYSYNLLGDPALQLGPTLAGGPPADPLGGQERAEDPSFAGPARSEGGCRTAGTSGLPLWLLLLLVASRRWRLRSRG